jgi:hypothetical protein
MISFDKETFKRSIQDNVKLFFRKKIGDASKSELFQAVAYAVKDRSLTNGSRPIRLTSSRTRRSFTTCPWNS